MVPWAALSAKVQRFNIAYNPLTTPWVPAVPEPGDRGYNSYQGYRGTNPLVNANSHSVDSYDSDEPARRELLPLRKSEARKPSEEVEDIDANWTEVDSDIDSPADLTYDPTAYRPPVSKLERASNIASNVTGHLTATGVLVASAATTFVAGAATSATQTAIKKAIDIAAAGEAAYRRGSASAAESMPDPYDELRFREPGQILGHWETQTPTHAAQVMKELQEDPEGSEMNESGLRALMMNLSELARVDKGMRESQQSVPTNTRRSRRAKQTRKRGPNGAGSKLESGSKQSEENGNEGEEMDEAYSSEDSEGSFDSCHEVLENRGQYIVEKAQRHFQRRQQKSKERKRIVREKAATPVQHNPIEQNPVQRTNQSPCQDTNSTVDGKVVQLQPERSAATSCSSRQPGDTAIQRSRPRRPPSPSSSKIAMISYSVDQLPRSNQSNRFFEWD
ncbi:uncharacterized protein IWZ02DRAFT_430669 [Phyllosticta citriasiana]|uniref:Uncharacterized protein n=1 Tax=Phyllosticta citriasiana TaxID=595635 RepID=A0ABR1KMG4_9PEZI